MVPDRDRIRDTQLHSQGADQVLRVYFCGARQVLEVVFLVCGMLVDYEEVAFGAKHGYDEAFVELANHFKIGEVFFCKECLELFAGHLHILKAVLL